MILLAALSLVLCIACLALGYRCGWLAARAYLSSAKTVLAAAHRTENMGAVLKSHTEAIDRLARITEEASAASGNRSEAVEEAIRELLAGFERAGFATPARRDPLRQHGEGGDNPEG